MNPYTGEIRRTELISEFEKEIGTKAVPLTETQAKELEKRPGMKRKKGYMRNQPCPCGSERKFKKCCWDQYDWVPDEEAD